MANWNLLLFAGLIFRVVYAMANDKYPFGFGSAEGVSNLRKKFVSALFVGIVYFIAFYFHGLDATMAKASWGFVAICFTLIGIGWSIDSLFVDLMDLIKQRGEDKLKSLGQNTPPPSPTERGS